MAATSMAQSPSGDAGKAPMGGMHHGMKPCSQEADPAKCEANRKEMRERHMAAREACKDKPDRRACMTEQYCSKAADKAQCQAQAKERQAKMSKRMDERQAAHEACTGKRGDELQKCLGAQRGASGRSGPAAK
jgi:hypothetical protein